MFQSCTPAYLVAKNITCRAVAWENSRKKNSRVNQSGNTIFDCLFWVIFIHLHFFYYEVVKTGKGTTCIDNPMGNSMGKF